MADDLGSIAWSFLPENEQVQYLQKIAQMRRKSIQAQVLYVIRTIIIFRTKCDFLLTIEVSTFSGQVSAIEARDAAIFTKI